MKRKTKAKDHVEYGYLMRRFVFLSAHSRSSEKTLVLEAEAEDMKAEIAKLNQRLREFSHLRADKAVADARLHEWKAMARQFVSSPAGDDSFSFGEDYAPSDVIRAIAKLQDECMSIVGKNSELKAE
jgi:hypothetical protein